MRKRIFSIFLAVAMIFCIIPLSAYADEHQHTFENKHGYDLSNLPEGYSIPCKIYESPCSSECGYSLYSWDVFGLSGQFVDKTGTSGLVVYQHYREWFEKIYGRNASASKYETGGGSAGTGGAGRRPSGYLDDAGTPTYNASGTLQMLVYPRYYYKIDGEVAARDSFRQTCSYGLIVYSNYTYTVTNTTGSRVNDLFLYSDMYYLDYVIDSPPVSGLYYTGAGPHYLSTKYPDGATSNLLSNVLTSYTNFSKQLSTSDKDALISRITYNYDNIYRLRVMPNSTSSVTFLPLKVYISPTTETVKQQTNITINNNTWNGNIYQDNSTNLTYIYPQYTTINENNETVTNISNNPIIYNNETKEYYTYDSVTNNYYYITYVTETPTPTPTPDPGTAPTPTPEPGGDTGDTTGILAVLVEIRDSMVQGFADLKATLVQGWADLSANFTLAIENLNLNITNIFNKKFPDQSTPETADPSPSPSPSPDPSPGPTPDPDSPDVTPTPTPPTAKPSGDTNNFWNFVFPGGNDDGTENGHKGILWALISLLIAVITFVLGLGSAYSYVFPFLPAGLVTTIHICVLVLLLFAIIKFVRSFL